MSDENSKSKEEKLRERYEKKAKKILEKEEKKSNNLSRKNEKKPISKMEILEKIIAIGAILIMLFSVCCTLLYSILNG